MAGTFSKDDWKTVQWFIADQPGWNDTPERRHQLLRVWLRGDGQYAERAHKLTGNMPLIAPTNAATDVIDGLHDAELSPGVNALAFMLGCMIFKSFDQLDRINAIIANLGGEPVTMSAGGTGQIRIFDVPHIRNPYFTGREDIIIHLRECLLVDGKTGLTQAISGLGGVGKTQTALEYAYRHQDDYQYVFWILGDSVVSLRSGYDDIAARLRLPRATQEDPEASVKSALSWLEQTHDYLLVIDNVDTPVEVADLLPEKTGWHVLLTSRNPDLEAAGIFNVVEMDALPLDDAVTLLLKRTRKSDVSTAGEDERASAKELAQELGCLPLALEQAGAYIRSNEMTIINYLVEYKTLHLRLLDEQGPVTGKYKESVRTTWWKSIEKVREVSPASVDLLTICAFLSPDRIPFEFVTDGADKLSENISRVVSKAASEVLGLNALLKPLRSYSLIKRDGAAKTFDVHRMVQSVIRDVLTNEEQTQWLDQSLSALSSIYPGAGALNWPRCERLLTHWLVSSLMANGKDLQSEAWVLKQAGTYFFEKANYAEALPLLERSLSIREHISGGNPLDVAQSLNDVAGVYRAMGHSSKALLLLERSLEIYTSFFGSEHPDVIAGLNNMAGLYNSLGRRGDALLLLERSLKISDRVHGPEHINVVQILNNMVVVYRAMGFHAKALPLCMRSLTICKNTLDASHPYLAHSLNNLASIYRAMGRRKEALPLLQQALLIRERVLGKNHPDVTMSLNDLALLYRDMRRFSDALSQFERSLEINELVFGPDHHEVATCLNNMATLHFARLNPSKALPLLERSLKINESRLGPEHPDVAANLINLARTHYALGHPIRAFLLLKRLLSILMIRGKKKKRH